MVLIVEKRDNFSNFEGVCKFPGIYVCEEKVYGIFRDLWILSPNQ